MQQKKSAKPSNMNHREKIALQRLKKRKDLIINMEDKGSGICLLTPTQYNKEVMKQLSDTDHYQKLNIDRTP